MEFYVALKSESTGKYLKMRPVGDYIKGEYNPKDSILEEKDQRLIILPELEIMIAGPGENSKGAPLVKLCQRSTRRCLDASEHDVTISPVNNNADQIWRIYPLTPFRPAVQYIMNGWSTVFLQAQYEQYLDRPTSKSTFVYYNKDITSDTNIVRFLTCIPAFDYDRDEHIILPNGASLRRSDKPDESIEQRLMAGGYHRGSLLDYDERRLARKIIVASRSRVFGYRKLNGNYIRYPVPKEGIIISYAGARFDIKELGYQDFIVERGDPSKPGLIPKYYPNGIKPSFEDAEANTANIRIDWNKIFLSNAYFRSCLQDIGIILLGFQHSLANSTSAIGPETQLPEINNKGWLKLTATGMGSSADVLGYDSIAKILEPIWIEAAMQIIESLVPFIPNIKIIEFPNYSGTYKPTKNINGIHLMESKDTEILKLDQQYNGYLVGIVNPSNAFAFRGDNHRPSSIEYDIGNNTDIKYRQVPIFNPVMVGPDQQIGFNIPDQYIT